MHSDCHNEILKQLNSDSRITKINLELNISYGIKSVIMSSSKKE